MIHVFYHPVREFYDLESLWIEAPRVKLDVPPEAIAARSPTRSTARSSSRIVRRRVKIVVLAVGKLRDRHLGARSATTTWRARAGTCRVEVVEVDDDAALAPQWPAAAARRSRSKPGGESWTTERFARHLGERMLHGTRALTFADRRRRRIAARRWSRGRRCGCRCRR